METNNLQNFLSSKKFYILVGVIIVILLILISLSTKSRTQSLTGVQPTQSIQPLDSSDSVSNSNNSQSTTQSEELKQAIVSQKKADQEYAGWEKSVMDKYPWRKKLPLTSEKYFVFFDINNKVFIARLYPKQGDDIEQLKSEILKELKEGKGIPVDNYKIEWWDISL